MADRIYKLASALLAAAPLVEAKRALLIAILFVELSTELERLEHKHEREDETNRRD